VHGAGSQRSQGRAGVGRSTHGGLRKLG
jgi:hypothetical protein